MPPKPRGFDAYTVEDRGFWTPCWIWAGAPAGGGYGVMRVSPKQNTRAHRAFYERFVGPIPDGLQLDHLCCVPMCVNPAHLEPVTPRENIMRSSGRSAVNAAKTYCIYGHPFTPTNTYVTTTGKRACRMCARDLGRVNQRKVRARRAGLPYCEACGYPLSRGSHDECRPVELRNAA